MIRRIRVYTRVAAGAWTLVAALLLLWHFQSHTSEMNLLARTEARASWRKDILYRAWATRHGGVYVPPSEKTPPNPYLSGFPDRDVVTTSGKRLTLLNPSYMTREVFEIGREKYGIYGRITSLRPVNPANAPDPWEAAALPAFEKGETEVSSVESLGGRSHMRLLRPLVIEEGCLKCHAAQGYKVGDVRGGLSVAIPMEPFYAFRRSVLFRDLLAIGLLWIGGCAVILAGGRRTVGYVARIEEREAETRESEERFRTLVENAGDAFFLHDSEGRFLDVNRRACETLGYTRDELLSMKATDVEVGLTGDVLLDLWSRSLPGEFVTSEGEERRKDGKTFPVEARVGAIERRGKKQIIVLARDITERKRAEEALKETERRYRSLYNTTPTMLHSIDREGRLVSVSDYWLEYMGYSREEVIGRKLIEFLTEASARYARDVVLPEFMRTGICKDIPYRMVKKNGAIIDVLLSATSEKDADGRIIRSMAAIQDITARKRIEDALYFVAQCGWTVSGDEFFPALARYLGEAFGVAYVFVDRLAKEEGIAETVALYARGKIVPNLRYDLRGTPCENVMGRKLCCYTQGVQNLFPNDAILSEMQAESYVGLPLWNSAGKPIGLIAVMDCRPMADAENITGVLQVVATRAAAELERNRAELENRRLQAQLQQAMKMEAVGRLAGGVAHDFNNLLTVILGSTSLALRKIPSSDPSTALLEESQKAAERAAVLTKQLLAFSRKQIIEPKVLNLNDLVGGLQKMLGRLIGENIELKSTLCADLGAVKIDPGQFEQILVNLAVNARDAMPDGGKLVVETSNVELDEGFCSSHPYVEPGKYVMLSVSDTGCGMTEEVRKNIFEPFFTTKPKGTGTGLGLSMIYGAVKQAGGYIEVYSEEGKGSTFKIFLPGIEGEAAKPASGNLPRDLMFGTGTVLLAEDEEAVRKLCTRFLESLGYRVLQAANGLEAIALAREHGDRVDLLMTDVVMPGMNGRELSKQLLRIHPETKVLFASGYTDNSIVHYGVLEDGISFIGKPYSLPALAKKIREILGPSSSN